MLALYFKELFRKVWAAARENKLSSYDAENREITITHTQIGARLAKKWQLPQGLVDTIRYHYSVSKSADDLNMLMIVHVADIIMNSHMSDSESEPDVSTI